MIAQIPFSGFYGSWHDGELDHTLEQMLSDSSGCHQYDNLGERAYFSIEWQKVHAAYAAAYAEAFCEEFKIVGKFESMVSPREYNFGTDRVFIELDVEEVRRIFHATSDEHLDRVCKEMFTSYSGFMSSYSPDWENDWDELEEWDHNQVFAVIRAYVEQEHGGRFEQDAEFDLVEGYRCNGYLEDWIYTNAGVEGKRAIDVANYLRSREDRKRCGFDFNQHRNQPSA